jgi:putative membrane protein
MSGHGGCNGSEWGVGNGLKSFGMGAYLGVSPQKVGRLKSEWTISIHFILPLLRKITMSNEPTEKLLMNKIDRQREHQANERTFLAWLRTSIALIGFGFAIARFGLFLRQLNVVIVQREPVVHPLFNSENLGIALVIVGVMAIALAAWRYNQVFWQIERDDYQPQRLSIWILTAAVMILGLLSIPLLLWRNHITPRPSSVSPQLQRPDLWQE